MENNIEIIPYSSIYHAVFKQLNYEWLDKYNLTDEYDHVVLEDPQGTIIDPGGYLWLVKAGAEVVGSAGIIKGHADDFELAKMSVAPSWRGKGISKLLLDTCLAKAREAGAKKMTLFSNHQLVTAIRLYEKYGFRHVAVTDSPFPTADIKMELTL